MLFLGIFFCRAGHPHNPAYAAALAAFESERLTHQPFEVAAIGLDPAGPPVDGQARCIDDPVFYSGAKQGSMQPCSCVAGFADRRDAKAPPLLLESGPCGRDLVAIEPAPGFLRRIDQLEHQGEGRLVREATLRADGAVPHGGKNALDRVRGPQVFPVFGGEIAEGEQGLAILRQAPGGLIVFQLIGRDEGVETRPRRTVGDGEFGRDSQASVPQIEQQFTPILRAFAGAVSEAEQFLPALRRRADDDQNALPGVFKAGLQVNAIGPHVDVALGRQIALAPMLVFVEPDLLQPRDRRGRQAGRILAEQRRKRLLEIAGRDALQVKDRDQYLQAARAPRVGRQDCRREANAPGISAVIRSRTRGWRTPTGPMPVITSRSGRCR
jgi:hypothetical protein